MFHPLLPGSALLRTQRALFPRTFTRYKSITAAIEKGRGSGPDRFSPRPASRPRRFGDDEVGSSRYGERDGRARPSRSKSSIGARRRRWEDEDAPPRRKELRKSGARSDESAVERRIREQEREDRPRFSEGRSREEDRSSFREARPQGRGRDDDARQRRSPRTDGDSRTSQEPALERRGREGQQDDYGRPDRRPRDPRAPLPARSERFDRMDRDRADRPDRSIRPDRDDRPDRPIRPDRDDRPHRSPQHSPARSHPPRDRAPDSLPYTTAASEFIYGYSSVLAAICAGRRSFYALYVNARGLNRDALLSRAKTPALRHITRQVGDSYDRAFDKASSGRPHNGFILEASPLPVPPITGLAETTKSSPTFDVVLGPQSKEDFAITGSRTSFPAATNRYPLILYLDSILDEGNLGAIARTAYFLGAEAIITPTRQSAPWSHIALKASAGAAEALPLFRVASPVDFFANAARNGWRCYAADAPPGTSPSAPKSTPSPPESTPSPPESTPSPPESTPSPPESTPSSAPPHSTEIIYTTPRSPTPLSHNPLQSHPTILILGAEDKGVKTALLNAAHYKVGIRRGRPDHVGVDSLNVSVAAGLLVGDLLQMKTEKRDEENVLF